MNSRDRGKLVTKYKELIKRQEIELQYTGNLFLVGEIEYNKNLLYLAQIG